MSDLPYLNEDGDHLAYVASQQIATALLGPAFAGWMLQIFLTGLTVPLFVGCWQQASRRLRWFISIVFFFNAMAAAFATYDNFVWGVSQNRASALDGLSGVNFVDCLEPLPNGVVGVLVQGWFARRVGKLFQTRLSCYVFYTLIGSAMTLGFLGNIGYSMLLFRYRSGTLDGVLPLTFAKVLSVWLWTVTFVDVANTATLGWLLWSRVAGFNRRTDSLLLKIIRLNVQTASYTATMAFVAAVLSSTMSDESYLTEDIPYFGWIVLPSLYTLGLLTTLVSRDSLLSDLAKPPEMYTTTWHTPSVARPVSLATVATSAEGGPPSRCVSPATGEEKEKRSVRLSWPLRQSAILETPRMDHLDVPQDTRQWWNSRTLKGSAGTPVVLSFDSAV